jgi:hypothetical protein
MGAGDDLVDGSLELSASQETAEKGEPLVDRDGIGSARRLKPLFRRGEPLHDYFREFSRNVAQHPLVVL